jgi:hypothetical protein
MLKKSLVVLLLLVSAFFLLTGCDQLYFKDYEASGTVKDSSGAGIESASINFSDGSSVKTQADGSWKQTGLNGDIEITPKKSGYTFSPSSFHLSQLDENKDSILFTANSNGTDSGDDSDNSGGDDGSDENSDDSDGTEDNLFVLSGKIKNESGESISDVIIHFNSGEFSSVTTAEDGSWEKEDLTGRVEVKAEKYGYTFEPPTRSLETSDENVNFTALSTENFYIVSGKVADEKGNGIENAKITFNNGKFSSVMTDADGNWEKSDLFGKVEIKAEKFNYTFEPATIPVETTDDNVNFTAIAEEQPYTVSGTITNEENIPIPDVVINFNDGTSVNTDYNGYWEKTGLTGEVVVTPELDDWQFSPANKTVYEENDITNFTAQPADNYEYYTLSGVVEDNNGANIHIEIRRASDNTLIANAITNDEGNWTSTSVWGTVIVTPQVTGSISGFTPENDRFSGPETEVNFRADY